MATAVMIVESGRRGGGLKAGKEGGREKDGQANTETDRLY